MNKVLDPQNPREAYEQHYNAALDTLAMIKRRLTEQHNDGTPKNWGHVGSMQHIVARLNELVEFLD